MAAEILCKVMFYVLGDLNFFFLLQGLGFFFHLDVGLCCQIRSENNLVTLFGFSGRNVSS